MSNIVFVWVEQVEHYERLEAAKREQTPIELLRYGPPRYQRPTINDLEDALIEIGELMTVEEVEEELAQAGINISRAKARLRQMIDDRSKAEASAKDICHE